MKAVYTHDCEVCVFLGHYAQHDLYYCPQGSFPTLIARYGNEGRDYLSGMEAAEGLSQREPTHPLAEALRLSRLRGIVRNP